MSIRGSLLSALYWTALYQQRMFCFVLFCSTICIKSSVRNMHFTYNIIPKYFYKYQMPNREIINLSVRLVWFPPSMYHPYFHLKQIWASIWNTKDSVRNEQLHSESKSYIFIFCCKSTWLKCIYLCVSHRYSTFKEQENVIWHNQQMYLYIANIIVQLFIFHHLSWVCVCRSD